MRKRKDILDTAPAHQLKTHNRWENGREKKPNIEITPAQTHPQRADGILSFNFDQFPNYANRKNPEVGRSSRGNKSTSPRCYEFYSKASARGCHSE